jgi:hypothetical protein
LSRIVPFEEGHAGLRRTIRKEWQSQAHMKWAGEYYGTMAAKYHEKALHGTNRVCAAGFGERSVRQQTHGKKTVRSGRTNML